MRGEIFDIDNKKFFTFGGDSSHNIQDGILNLDEKDMQNEIKNLEKTNFKINYIISHCYSTSIQALLRRENYKKDYLTDY